MNIDQLFHVALVIFMCTSVACHVMAMKCMNSLAVRIAALEHFVTLSEPPEPPPL